MAAPASDALQFAGGLARSTGLSSGVLLAWMAGENNITQPRGGGDDGAAGTPENWLNIGINGPTYRGSMKTVWATVPTAVSATNAFLRGRFPGWGTGNIDTAGILRTAGQSPQAQLAAIQRSGWISGTPGVSSYSNLSTAYNLYGKYGGRSVGQGLVNAGQAISRPVSLDTSQRIPNILADYYQRLNAPNQLPEGNGQFVVGPALPPSGPQAKKLFGTPFPFRNRNEPPKGFPQAQGNPGISLPDPFTGIADAIEEVTDFFKLIGWLFDPETWLRGVEFLTGIAMFGFGLQATVQAYRESPRGGRKYYGQGGAVRRSGAGRAAAKVVEATPAGRAARVAAGRRAGRAANRAERRSADVERGRKQARKAQPVAPRTGPRAGGRTAMPPKSRRQRRQHDKPPF